MALTSQAVPPASTVGFARAPCRNVVEFVPPGVSQEFLHLLALYNAMLQAITSKDRLTLARLNKVQRDLVLPFVKAYEALVGKIKADQHCTAKAAKALISVTFPKLHLLLHMCDQLAHYGHVWFWNTGECTDGLLSRD